MKKLALLLFVAAFAVLASIVLYFSLARTGRESPPPSLSGVAPTADSSGAESLEPGPLDAKDLTALADSPAQRAAIALEPGRGLAPEKICTLSVDVAMPAGAPADDEPELLVLGEVPEDVEFEEILAKWAPGDPTPKWLLARVPLSPGTATEISLERSPAAVTVALRARFSFAMSALRVDIAGEHGFAKLSASLGACVRGRLIPPSDATPTERELAGATVRIRSDAFDGAMGGDRSKAVSRRSVCDAGGSFELGGIAPIEELALSGTPEHLAAFKTSLAGLAAGKLLHVEVALERGARASGRVIDDGGNPVGGAKIAARGDPVWGKGSRLLREGKSREDGTFSLNAIAAGLAIVEVSAKGYLETTENIEFFEGVELNDMVLSLQGGGRVAGTVVWADGSPAAAVEVKVSFDPAHLMGMGAFNAMRGAASEGRTDERGAFSIGGLGKGPFVVAASAVPGAAGEGEEAPKWTAQIANIKPGTLDLKLTLAPPGSISGRVVDDAGIPIADCSVAIVVNHHNPWLPGAANHNVRVANPEGTFSATNLQQGEYTAKAQLKTGAASPTVSFEVPRAVDAGELLITLPRPATISGRVLLPDGTPAANARVQQHFSIFEMQRNSSPGSEPSCTTGADGTFTTTALPPGAISLRATKEGFAPSDPVALNVEPAGALENVTLALRVGGTITGEAFGKDGLPKAGGMILAQMPDLKHGQLWTKSDASGAFQYANVAPGQWQVMLLDFDTSDEGGLGATGDAPTTSSDGSESSSSSDAAKAQSKIMDQLKIAMANVKDGTIVHVLLGAPAKDPVHVRGRVTASKTGVAGVMVSFVPTDGDQAAGAALNSMKMKTSDEDGRFEVDLDHSGSYLVSVQKIDMNSGSQQSVEFSRTVPDGPDCSLEFELPLGSITGRVSNAAGDLLPRARITLSVDGPLQGGTLTGGRYSEATTDSAGEFALDWLAPGTYTVAAGGQAMTMAGLLYQSAPPGRQVRDGIRVSEGEHVGGIDFKLKTACELTGKVLDADGKPAAEASIFLRDEEGRPVDRISMTVTDSGGTFRQRGLSAGRYSVSARSDAAVSEEATVLLRDGEPASVELRLEDGTMLTVVVTDKDDAPVQVSLSITDEKGRQVNGVYSLADLMHAFSDGSFDAKQPRIGPLAPGKYTITAIAPDGTRLTRSVTLLGQSKRKITLQLKE